MVPYRAGEWYFHGGASLQEAVVPVIAVRMQEADDKFVPQAKITLSYKRGATKITTRLPVIVRFRRRLPIFSRWVQHLRCLWKPTTKRTMLLARSNWAAWSTLPRRTLSIKPGQTLAVTLRMDLEFEGNFTVKALDPVHLDDLQQIGS